MRKQKSWADYNTAIRNVYTKQYDDEEDNDEIDDNSIKSPGICKLHAYMHICMYTTVYACIHV